MWPTSEEFDVRIVESGNRVTKISAYDRWDTGTEKMVATGTTLVEGIQYASCTITADRNADSRRTATIVSTDATLNDILINHTTNPLGIEFEIEQGVVLSSGEPELVPQGIFMVDNISWTDRENIVTINLVDRSKRLTFFEAEETDHVGPTNSPTVVVENYLYSTGYANFTSPSPALIISPLPASVTNEIYFTVRSPWDAIKTIADILNEGEGEVFFDRQGTLWVTGFGAAFPAGTWYFTPEVNLESVKLETHMLTFTNKVITSATFDNTNNQVVVGGQVIVGGITDPTGPAGWRTKIIDIEPEQAAIADDIALGVLGTDWGLERRITVKGIGNPALDIGDPVVVTIENGEEITASIEGFTIDHAFQQTLQLKTSSA